MADEKGVTRRSFLKMAAVSATGVSFLGESRASPASAAETAPGGKSVRAYQKPTGEPYKPMGKRIVFTNWLYIRPGSFGWFDDQGKNITVNGSAGPWEAHFKRYHFPHGIKITAQKAQKTGPVLKKEMPWEDDDPGFYLATVINDGGIYKAWGGGAYYKSKDGINWNRPELGLVEINGSKANNHVPFTFIGGTVFKDPSAPDSERYKYVFLDSLSHKQFDEFKNRRPDAWEPRAYREDVKHIYALRGAISPDGLNWTRLPEPFALEHSDTHVTGYYDERLNKYVIYTRNYMIGPRSEDSPEGFRMWWDIGRRSIGRTESDNFREFPISELVMEPDPSMPPYDLIYTNTKTTIPGAPDHHLLFPDIWHAALDDTTSTNIASSHDGKIWHTVPGSPVFETSNFGEWDGGCHFCVPNLIELANGDFALPYNGYLYPHKYPRGQWKMGVGYAVWPKGRIVALEAPELGEFTMVSIIPPGRKLRINAVTERAGSIKVEATDWNLNTLPGRSFDECDPIIGDQYNKPVTWKGKDDLGHNEGKPVALRFKLDRAKIYALEFE